jgi:hypothetical protein
MAFIDTIKEKAKADKKTIVLPESMDKRTYEAAEKILKEGIANLIIIGTPEEIAENGKGYDISGATVVDPFNDPNKQKYIDKFVELRAKKGVTPEQAKEMMEKDYMYYACLMCKCGDADGAVSGACHSTGNTIRPALQLLKCKPGVSSTSGFFLMEVPDCELGENGLFVFADCAVNIDPDSEHLAEIAAYFTPLREEWIKSGLMSTKVMGVNIKTLLYQVPGGMLSNLVSQLKEMKAEDKFTEVLEEVPRVRKDFGEPPLVTPSSQIVGTQAVLNVVLGERYKNMTKESKDLLLGKYGKTVKPFNPEVQKKAIELSGEQPITCRFADTLKPELAKLESEMKQYKQQDEDVLSYALFPQVATDFFKYREAQQTKVDATVAKDGAYPV